MKTALELKTIKEYLTLNGRQVPVYKITRYTEEDVRIANEEAAKKLKEELGEPSSPKEIFTLLHDHAEEIKKESEMVILEPTQNQEETHE